ncbi:MAG: cytochrome c biogenesis protein CcsA [Micavibrio sp.]
MNRKTPFPPAFSSALFLALPWLAALWLAAVFLPAGGGAQAATATATATTAATTATAETAPPLDMYFFAQLPVQHDGRLKPLDSFARLMLEDIHGKSRFEGKAPAAWLAEILFDPGAAVGNRVFRVFRPQLLGLPARKDRAYSFAEIAPALAVRGASITALSQKDPASWSADQAELMALSERAGNYAQLLRSFSLILPLNIPVPETLAREWGLEAGETVTAQDYRRHAKALEDRLQKILAQKGGDPERYSEEEQDIALFAFQMKSLEAGAENNLLLRVLPGTWDAEEGLWYSPWAALQSGQASPENAAYLEHWKALALAYRQGDTARWAISAQNAYSHAKDFADTRKTALEIIYNNTHPLTLAMLLYGAALALLAIAAGMKQDGKTGWPRLMSARISARVSTRVSACMNAFTNKAAARGLAIAALCGGAVFHGGAIAARVIILDRPPVGTLYESVIFVALVGALIGLAYELRSRNRYGVLSGAGIGLFLLFIAQGFSGGDTMPVLVAVLNTNFWLATHVICITIGYGWCIAAAVFAHFWLWRRARGEDAAPLLRPAKITVLTALCFTATGTILGGIWADQSWGRFWGWDPKENGALLIILWIVWLLHARIAGQIGELLYMAGIAALSIIVALAWFGVNLLNIGLHSYGFISGVAAGLALFCAAQGALIAALYVFALKKEGKTNAA